MKIYTKTGDQGQTSLLSQERVAKDNLRVQAYGTVDEANAAMGLARALCSKDWINQIIYQLQEELVPLNADLATVDSETKRITSSHVHKLETLIDQLAGRLSPQKDFITPGTTTVSAGLDLARTIVRRAERCVVSLTKAEKVSEPIPLYLNRLSDLLFVLARCEEQESIVDNVKEAVKTVLSEKEQIQRGQGVMGLSLAKEIIGAAEVKAKEIGVPMVIAVVDAGANLVAQHRMDDALLASISISLDKAYTAVALRMSTDQAASLAKPGEQLYGLNTTNSGRLVIFGGGIPIYINGVLVGAIGVSGGSVNEDVTVATAGLSVLSTL